MSVSDPNLDARIARIARNVCDIQGKGQGTNAAPSFAGPSIPGAPAVSVVALNSGPAVWVPIFTPSSCAISAIVLGGVNTGLTMPANSQLPIVVPADTAVELLWSGTGHPSWPNWFPIND